MGTQKIFLSLIFLSSNFKPIVDGKDEIHEGL